MTYQLTATKLQAYHRCPQAYFFRYERKVSNPQSFKSPQLGIALHQALAQFYQDWHYLDPKPSLTWLDSCWQHPSESLSDQQQQEGRAILQRYFEQFVEPEIAMKRPLAVESRIQGRIQVGNLEFNLTGRCDRIDWLDEGLELIDYKTAKAVRTPEPLDWNIQMGLYYLALAQQYSHALQRVSLIYLRTAEKVSFEVTPDHYQRVEELVSELATKLRTDEHWHPTPTEECQQCTYSRYCPAQHEEPEPLPETAVRHPRQSRWLNECDRPRDGRFPGG